MNAQGPYSARVTHRTLAVIFAVLTCGLAVLAADQAGADLQPAATRLVRAHDPSTIVKCKDEFSVFCTGRNIVPPLYSLFAPEFLAGVSFQMQYWATAGQTYILETSTDLLNWTPLSTNTPSSAPFTLLDIDATNAATRFYRVVLP